MRSSPACPSASEVTAAYYKAEVPDGEEEAVHRLPSSLPAFLRGPDVWARSAARPHCHCAITEDERRPGQILASPLDTLLPACTLFSAMSTLAHHFMLRCRDDRVLTPSVGTRRALARVVLAQGRGAGLLAFRAADTHLHVLSAVGRPEAGELGRRLSLALGRVLALPVGFEPVRIVPVLDQRHLSNAFHYILGQDQHHGFGHDPTHDASNLPDLLGLRVIGVFTADSVRNHLPRVNRTSLLAHLGADPQACSEPLAALADAAAAAVGLHLLVGREPLVVAARRAAVIAAGATPISEVAELLSLPLRTTQRLRCEGAPPELVRAVRLQLGLRARCPEPAFVAPTPQPGADKLSGATCGAIGGVFAPQRGGDTPPGAPSGAIQPRFAP